MSVAELRKLIDDAPVLAALPDSFHPAREECDPSARFAASMVPITAAEMEAAKQPHAHAFQHHDTGLFPEGEVSVIAGPGREGKTYAEVGLMVHYVLGHRVVGMKAQSDRSVLIYSAEDDRAQYVRKLAACCARLGREDADKLLQRIIVPDLYADGMEAFQTLVGIVERQPVATLAVDLVIKALEPRMAKPCPPGIVIFETASTLSDAEEDNRAFRVIIRGLRRIARQLRVAVVLVHHTSQAATNGLPDLNVSVADIRGATALAYNSRQNLLMVNLGSDEEPFPDADARTVLRHLAAPDIGTRVSCLIPLDSSKGMDPPPMFFQWNPTTYGPALSVLCVPNSIAGMRWRKLRQVIQAQRTEARQARKDTAQTAEVDQVVELVGRLVADGQPTVKRVSTAAGHGADWARPRLAAAAKAGRLVCNFETVPRSTKKCSVYRPIDWSAIPDETDRTP